MSALKLAAEPMGYILETHVREVNLRSGEHVAFRADVVFVMPVGEAIRRLSALWLK